MTTESHECMKGGKTWEISWNCSINVMLQNYEPGKRISTPALRDVSKSKLTVCWLALSPLSPLHSLYSYSEPRTSDGRTEFCLLFTICVSVVQLSSLLFQLFLLFPISPQQALRLSWAPPLKYDSHYSGYNLLAFFNVFMTASSYQQPIIAELHIQSTRLAQPGSGVKELPSSQLTALLSTRRV